jgi:hypothetical protein
MKSGIMMNDMCMTVRITYNLAKGMFLLFLVWFPGALKGNQPPKDINEKLFTLLSPDHTKVYFNNELVDKEAHSVLIYSNYYGGGGVGIADINNDGLQDIFFTGNLVGDRLYLNKGNMVFEDITEQAGIENNGGWSSGVAFGDVNSDGYQDIYVSRELYDEKPELWANRLYINNGDNTFTESAKEFGVDGDQRTRQATFLDYDKDGDLDLFLCNQPPNPGVYSQFYLTELLLDKYSPTLYENQGDTFIDVTKKAGLYKPGFPNSVSASDFNNDGWTDLWLANDYWAGDFIYINNGDGTFTDMTGDMAPHITFSSMGIDAGDINNDGLLDGIVLDMEPEDHYRRNRNMGGMKPGPFRDVLNEGGHHQYFTNTLFLNRGNGFYSEISQLAGIGSTDWSWTSLFADLDNDGWKDIFIANGLMRDIRDNDAAVEFPRVVESAIHQYLKENPNQTGIGVWDVLDMQKALDISPSVKLLNYAYRNNKDLTFSNVTEDWGFVHKTFSNGGGYADLDNDGDLDIVINNINEVASIYQNNSDKIGSNHFLRIKPVADQDNVTYLGTKIWVETQEGIQFFELTCVRGMYSGSEHIAHFGMGMLNKAEQIIVKWPDGKINIEKNVKADQELEILYSKSKSGEWEPGHNSEPVFENITGQVGFEYSHQENAFDDFSRQILLPYKMSELGPFITTGDVDGNGLDDFFIGGAAGTAGQMFIQNTGGTFTPLESETLYNDKIHEDMGAAFFDADGDGDQDLYVVSGGNEFRPRASFYQDRLYLNDGSGNLIKAGAWLPRLNISGSKVYPHDIDGDGDIDLFLAGRHIPWSYPDPESSVILINNGDKFENKTSEIAPELKGFGMVNDAEWVDFNQDGLSDLVVVGEWMPVSFFQNEGGAFRNVTDELGLNMKTGWWFSIESADMDGDGDQDLIAGNFGLNSKYNGTAEEPFEVYYADLDNNGLKDIVLVYTTDGRKYPYRRRGDAIAQIPGIKEKFKTYGSYAESDVFEIYGKENLGRALHYQANAFESVYIENTGNTSFAFHPLPVEAQFSSINDILINDYNKDDNLDILIAGNMYGMEVRTARNDASIGLFLAGDGQGGFKTVRESGFFVPYDVKSLAEIRVNDSKYIIVGCNNDRMRIFKVNNP